MKEKFSEIAAAFRGSKGLMAAWVGITAVLVCAMSNLPGLASVLLVKLTGSEKLAAVAAVISLIWLLMLVIMSLVSGLKNFRVRLSLFGNAENTAKLGALGVFNLVRGGSVGVLLIVPSVFYLVFKLVFAGILGYVYLMAKLSRAILTHTVPSLRGV